MPRVFLSFRMADLPCRDALVRRLRGGPVEIRDYPVGDLYDPGWQTLCAAMILDAEGVIVLVGPTTAGSEPVRWEIAKANELGKPIVAVRLGGRVHAFPEGLTAVRVLDWGPGERGLDRLGKELERWSPTVLPPLPYSETVIWTGSPR